MRPLQWSCSHPCAASSSQRPGGSRATTGRIPRLPTPRYGVAACCVRRLAVLGNERAVSHDAQAEGLTVMRVTADVPDSVTYSSHYEYVTVCSSLPFLCHGIRVQTDGAVG